MKNKVINLFNNKKVQNTEVKYSELLEQFMRHFTNDFIDIEYFEDLVEFGINAWNFGNLKVLVPKEDFLKTTNSIEDEDVDLVLLNKMINYKVSKFKKYTNFILDYELTETNADPILEVTTQPEEDYLSNILNSIDNEINEDDFEENYINRKAIIIKPKQPFLDWYCSLYPENDLEEEVEEPNIYLITEAISDVEKWLRKKFDKFFTLELADCEENKKKWPQRRNYKMFTLWFRVEISEMVYDLEKKPVLKI